MEATERTGNAVAACNWALGKLPGGVSVTPMSLTATISIKQLHAKTGE
jgi:hypothetical protein